MPRDSNGTMTAPSGQPVVGGTPALATVFNLLVADLVAELTDSLSRSGKGGMLAPMEFADGSVGDPSLTFVNNPTCGLYRAGAGDIRLSHLGVDMAVLTTALLKLIGHCVDGASAVGVTLDTVNALTTTGAKLLSVLNNAVEKFSIDKDGAVTAGGGVTAGGNITASTGLFSTLAAVAATLKGNIADGASAVGVILDCANALSTSGAKALSVRNAGVEKASIDKDGKGFFSGADLSGGTISNLIGLALGGGIASGLGAPSAATDAMRYGDSFAVPTPTRPSLGSGWTNGSGGLAVGYWKDQCNIVHLLGHASWATGGVSSMFTLPAGHRPAAVRDFPCVDRSNPAVFRVVYIGSTGTVQILGDPDNGKTYTLDGINFLAEA